MRLLHTSDWHIGRTFHGHATYDALRQVLAALAAAVEAERVDAVLVAGDVFDSATPPAAAFALFEEAVTAIRAAGATVVMTSGNHDSVARLGHQAPFAAAGGVHVLTRADRLDAPVVLDDEHGSLDVYGIPFLDPLLLGVRTHADALGAAMDRIRDAAAARGNRSIVLAHCFAQGGVQQQATGGERDITAGGLDVVPADVFGGDAIHYVALGHLHSRAQLAPHVRYSGAPLHFTFGETSAQRGAWLIDLDGHGVTATTWIELPVPRPLSTLTGTLDELLADPAHEQAEQHWIQAVLTDAVRQQDAMARLRARFPYAARLEFRPQGVRPADARSYGERTAGQPDAELIAGFLQMVRQGAGPSDAESRVVADVLAAVDAAERAA